MERVIFTGEITPEDILNIEYDVTVAFFEDDKDKPMGLSHNVYLCFLDPSLTLRMTHYTCHSERSEESVAYLFILQQPLR